MSNFIKRVYPRLPKEQWKNEIKTESVSKDENCINIVELLFPRTGYEFNSRKKQTLHKDVDSFKSMIREEFKDKIDNAQTEQLESGLIQTHSENLPPIYFTISNIQTLAILR